MSETCIVCLGNLDAGNPLPENPLTPSDASRGSKVASRDRDHDKAELIAHLIPCGHNLHDECLKPWVERANSCPICRQNFNTVELCSEVGGESNATLFPYL